MIEFEHKLPACYLTGYEVSQTLVDVRYILTDIGMRYDVYSPAKTISAHILLPTGKACKTLLTNGAETDFSTEKVRNSDYVNVNATANGKISFEILFF